MNQPQEAPRVTKDAILANIVHTEIVKHITHSGQVLRWAVITMRNGFSVTGKPSAAVCPENDNVEIGEKVAYDNAFSEIWPLMGYALKERLSQQSLLTGDGAGDPLPPVSDASYPPGARPLQVRQGHSHQCVCGCPPEKMDRSSAHADYCHEK